MLNLFTKSRENARKAEQYDAAISLLAKEPCGATDTLADKVRCILHSRDHHSSERRRIGRIVSEKIEEVEILEGEIRKLRAITATPELYEALEFLIEGLPEKPNRVGMYSLGAVNAKAVEDARSALANARREQAA